MVDLNSDKIPEFENLMVQTQLNKVNLVIYFIDDDEKVKYLMQDINDQLHFFTERTNNFDNNPVFTASRIFCEQLKGIFSKTILSELIEKKEFSLNYQKPTTRDYIQTNILREYLEILTSNEANLKRIGRNEIIYFFKTTKLDLEYINKILKNNSFDLKFDIYERSKSSNNKLSIQAIDIFNKFDDSFLLNQTPFDKKKLIIILDVNKDIKNFRTTAGNMYPSSLFQGFLRDSDEIWQFYSTYEGEFPSDEILQKASGMIIPGSALSVLDDEPHLRKVEDLIRRIVKDFKNIKILGICFGHQIISNALGGKVDQTEIRKKTVGARYLGPESIELSDELWNLEFMKDTSVEKCKNVNIMEVHEDEVSVLPNECTVIAFSKNCKYEILYYPNYNILTFQGHPEYEEASRMLRLLYLKKFDEEKLKELSTKKGVLNLEILRGICYNFLKKN